MVFKFAEMPSIEERADLGGQNFATDELAIVPFDAAWDADNLSASFRQGSPARSSSC